MSRLTPTLDDLGREIRLFRTNLKLTQDALADQLSEKVNRGTITHLEQNSRALPSRQVVEEICEFLQIPSSKWSIFFEPNFQKRAEFERHLAKLVGVPVSLSDLDDAAVKVLEGYIEKFIPSSLPMHNNFEAWNTVLVFYSIRPISETFFSTYLKEALTSFDGLASAIETFQKDAIRLFSNISEAYKRLNTASPDEFFRLLDPLQETDLDEFSERTYWTAIDKIPSEDLPFLGYIAASNVRETRKQREDLHDFLVELATKKKAKALDLEDYGIAKRRRMASLLSRFAPHSTVDFFAPLFNPDSDALLKDAKHVQPTDEDVERMERTQTRAYSNLTRYLSADYLDVYVATSMREDADFVSVNDFVEGLFKNTEINHLKLRYFNPTQSWIEDRVAKGLVEALMLRRARICIYMAQKGDTFGKDSEASVTLGQGKSVIVYVPKLSDSITEIDTEKIGELDRGQRIAEIRKLSADTGEIDVDVDDHELFRDLVRRKLDRCSQDDLFRITKNHWADFDLDGELQRIDDDVVKASLQKWLEASRTAGRVGEDAEPEPQPTLSDHEKGILIQTITNVALAFEKRATVFRQVHPLALQIILASRVLNGILVARSSDTCARLVKQILQNKLETDLLDDGENYQLIERQTKSVIRVISRHQLIANSFKTFYKF